MAFHLYKMTLQGKIAMANLTAIGLAAVSFLLIYPKGLYSDAMMAHRQWADFFIVVVMVVSFPVGWVGGFLGDSFCCLGGHIIDFPLSVPLNAYLWGYVGEALARRRRQRQKSKPPADAPPNHP